MRSRYGVPQIHDSVPISSAAGDQAAIRTEYQTPRTLRMPGNCVPVFSRFRVPEVYAPITTTTGECPTIWMEGEAPDQSSMSSEPVLQFARF